MAWNRNWSPASQGLTHFLCFAFSRYYSLTILITGFLIPLTLGLVSSAAILFVYSTSSFRMESTHAMYTLYIFIYIFYIFCFTISESMAPTSTATTISTVLASKCHPCPDVLQPAESRPMRLGRNQQASDFRNFSEKPTFLCADATSLPHFTDCRKVRFLH